MKFLVLDVLLFVTLAQGERNLSNVVIKKDQVWQQRLAEHESRIITVWETEPNEYPYQVGLFIDTSHFCGGSIINEKTVLTSANCVYGAIRIEVVAGAHRIHKREDSQQRFISLDHLLHEQWDPWYKTNDVALIFLPSKLSYTTAIQPINFYEGSDNFIKEYAYITGWGRFSDSSSASSPALRMHATDIISNSDCKQFYYDKLIKDSHLCLGGTAFNRNICNGDFGGPLVIINEQNVTIQIGIASFGSSWGCSIGYPGVYTRISSFASWIKTSLRPY